MYEKDERPLYTLTVDEFVELNRTIHLDLKYLDPDVRKEITHVEDIIFVPDVVKLTNYKESTIYSKVCRGEMPVLSTGRPLTFSRKQLIKWIEDGRPNLAEVKMKEFLQGGKKGGKDE